MLLTHGHHVRACMRIVIGFFFSSRRRHTRLQGDWSSDVCSSDLAGSRRPPHRTSVPTRGVFASRRGRRVAVALGVVLAVVGVGAAVRLLRGSGWHLNDRRVVVAVIENHTGDPSLDNVGHMAADWVTQGLAQTGLVEGVPAVSVVSSSRTSGGHGLGHLDAVGIQTLGRETGAGTGVSGAYYRQAGSVRLQVQISAPQ